MWHRSGSTVAQVKARCLIASSHYLNECWLLTDEVLWQSHESNFTLLALWLPFCNEYENYTFIITATSPMGFAILVRHSSYGCDDVIKWSHFPHYWPFMWGIHKSPVNSPHKGQWRRALMFSLICAWTNGWVNTRDAGDLRHHRTHYDVTVMETALKYLQDTVVVDCET